MLKRFVEFVALSERNSFAVRCYSILYSVLNLVLRRRNLKGVDCFRAGELKASAKQV